MLLTESKRKRTPFTWIDFSESKKGQQGFAKNWFFWVHSAFKPALDIYHLEQIDTAKTNKLRDQKCIERFGITHSALKKQIKDAGEQLSDSPKHRQIMAFTEKVIIETQGAPLVFSFRATDSLESKCGEWFVQVTQDNSATEKVKGNVGFHVYGRTIQSESGGIWEKKGWFATTQTEFVELLRIGRCDVLDLEDPFFPPLDNSSTSPDQN